MIRILLYLVLLFAAAYFADWLLQHPGHVDFDWFGVAGSMSAPVGFGLILLAAVAGAVLWSLARLIFGLPSFVMLARRQRRREKGYAALSQGLIAAGAGDARTASRASALARKHLRDDPLALMLQAQAARLRNDPGQAEALYAGLAQRGDTRILGLRGLHDEALRRGDDEAARHFAEEAHQATPLPWSAQTVLAHKAADSQWEEALATVETSIRAKLVDRATGERQRAVLQTAIGLEKQDIAPDDALDLARSAMKHAPDLIPAIALAARLYTRKGEIRRAAKLIESVWTRSPHPELARVYLDVRPGDSTSDRLARAQTLMRISAYDSVSRLTVARTALAARQFGIAREAMAPLISEGKRPSVRTCLVMADLEDAESGDKGHWREWLARAARAPLDPAWIADGIVYEQWEPVSPTTGRLDAFVWQAPADRPGHAMEAMPAPPPEPAPLPPAPPVPVVITHYETVTPSEAPATDEIPERPGIAAKHGNGALPAPPGKTGPALETSEPAAPVPAPKQARGIGTRDVGAKGIGAKGVQTKANGPFKLRAPVAPDDPGIGGENGDATFRNDDAPVPH